MNAEAASNIKFRQYENEIEKKKRDEENKKGINDSTYARFVFFINIINRKMKRNE